MRAWHNLSALVEANTDNPLYQMSQETTKKIKSWGNSIGLNNETAVMPPPIGILLPAAAMHMQSSPHCPFFLQRQPNEVDKL